MSDDLVKIALLGTSKAPASNLTFGEHPADPLVDQLASDDREHQFLLRLGARAVCDQCGQIARRDIPAVPPAPAETARVIDSPALVELLQTVMETRAPELLADFLNEVARHQLLLPAVLLPNLLEIRHVKVRDVLPLVVGERGRWLSQFRDEWRWAGRGDVAGDEKIEGLQKEWEEGDSEQRLLALRATRHLQPELARTWIAAAIAKEKADVRAALLEVLRIGLSAEDQTFLEERLDDQSEKVRALVAELLSQLPGSSLAQRMLERADALLQTESAGFLRRKQKIVCTPPEEIDKTWERDGISKKPPTGLGKKSFWVRRVLLHVPPVHWTQRFESDPAALIDQVGADPFAENVIGGWTDAAINFAATDAESRAWLTALAAYWLSGPRQISGKGRDLNSSQLSRLLEALSPSDAETAVLHFLEESPIELQGDESILLDRLHRPWGATFSSGMISMLKRGLRKAIDNEKVAQIHAWSGLAATAAVAIPPESFAAGLDAVDISSLQKESQEGSIAGRLLEGPQMILRRRELFHRTIREFVDMTHSSSRG